MIRIACQFAKLLKSRDFGAPNRGDILNQAITEVDRDPTQKIIVFIIAIQFADIQFVQLYATTPHVHATCNKHPVSRVITTFGTYNPNHARKILHNATTYIQHMEDLTRKSVCRTLARIEAVYLLEDHFPISLAPRDFYNMPAVYKILEEIPMLLPFKHNSHGLGLSHMVLPIASYLTTTLNNLLTNSKGKERRVQPRQNVAKPF
ncbi:hypothetical protein DPX16_14990 [Anabarilius grahami]|uniref:Uncharacterized protein n=1 Tax=Anabarilius grahami TaxID=495550 RepID=A0A3N0YWU1_ANAGA|nr:hypothetical protein DPX16_14990 [Anabarilius grahami]